MRALLVVLSLAGLAAAQGLPPPSRIDSWESKKNQKRLAINWDGLPRDKPTKLPDGSIEKAKAPWPFLLYIAQADSKSKRKIQDRILADTRFALATRLCPIIQVNPEKAIDLKYLASVSVRDPTLVVCRRDFSVVGTLRESKEFTDKKCLSLMARAVDGDYNGRLGKYLTGYIKLMREAEKLWKTEQKIEDLSERAGKKSKVDQARIFKEVEQLEKELLAEEEKLLDKEDAIKASMRIKADKEEEIATTVGKGKKKRELTPEELEAIRAFKKFSRDKNPIVRAAAVEDLGAVDSAIIVDYILKATNDTDPRVPLAAGDFWLTSASMARRRISSAPLSTKVTMSLTAGP